jgi:ribosomal protein L21E
MFQNCINKAKGIMRSNIIVNLTAGERVFVKIAPSFTQGGPDFKPHKNQ